MKPHLQYLRYVLRHKWFVLAAGLRVGGIPIWRLLIHDWSKFSSTEWAPYVRRFYGGRSGTLNKANDPEEFHRAWTHHWHTQPHHWEHWLALTDATTVRPMEIPEHFAREMVADWMGAGRAITGKWEAAAWYEKNQGHIQLAPLTRLLVVDLLRRHLT